MDESIVVKLILTEERDGPLFEMVKSALEGVRPRNRAARIKQILTKGLGSAGHAVLGVERVSEPEARKPEAQRASAHGKGMGQKSAKAQQASGPRQVVEVKPSGEAQAEEGSISVLMRTQMGDFEIEA